MKNDEIEETRAFWNKIADEWHIQVGCEGDINRILNSDPVLWEFAGQVKGLDVLDAGCGTGYLSRKLDELGAKVICIDFSEEMIRIARSKAPGIDFRLDSCSELASVGDSMIDLVIANYVLMDVPDLEGALAAFYRVLRSAGFVVSVFSHPCFPQGRATVSAEDGSIRYKWNLPYFERQRCTDPAWGHFTMDFIWFHRCLSDYWKAFRSSGFRVLDFDEPRLTEDRYHLVADENQLTNFRDRPYSVAFKLQKK